jgi:hypothetical protein
MAEGGGEAKAARVATRVVSSVAGGVPTEVILTEYSDRFFVVVNQLGTIGTLVRGKGARVPRW